MTPIALVNGKDAEDEGLRSQGDSGPCRYRICAAGTAEDHL